MDHTTILNKAYGTLIGSALGDTIGIYTEFMSPQQAKESYPDESFSLVDPVTPFHKDQHRIRFESRVWTDDTDHTLLLVLSFLRTGELSEADFASRLRTWCQQGLRCLDRLPMGLGKTVGSVVFSETFLSGPSAAAFAYWDKSGRKIAPNGSIMRTSPIGIICLNRSEDETFHEAIRIGAITHADARCSVSVAIASGLIRSLCREETKTVKDVDALVERAWDYMQKTHSSFPLDRAEFDKHVYASTLDTLVLCDASMGYVYKCLGSALWSLRQVMEGRETFKSAMVRLTMAGGDADTNGALACALMGAYVGYDALPTEWKDGMKYEEWYRQKTTALCIVAGLIEGEYDAEKDTDTALDGGRGFLSEDEMKKREMQIMEKILLNDQRRREAESEAKRNAKNNAFKRLKFW